jgi:enterobactin synthetase component D / holo-[acyl-carrier protein] synthase
MPFPAVLPPWVARACGSPDACALNARIALPDPLRRAIPKRQLEFVAGRRCAAAALATLGLTSHPLPIGRDGAPVWPTGVVGSITHTDGFVCAAAALARDAEGLGIDAEPVLSRHRVSLVEHCIATRAELAAVTALARLDRAAALTLVFSAKEALYKCLYPLVGRVFDYLEADVEDVDAAGHVTMRVLADLSSEWPAGSRVGGRFEIVTDRVFTAFVLVRGRT